MVKIRRESNEDLEPSQAPPVAGIHLSRERLQQLRRVSVKEKTVKAPKRIRKPKKQRQRSNRAVTDRDAQEIWNRRQAGQSYPQIARALLMRVQTVHYSYRKMLERGCTHIDRRLFNGRKTKSKITPALAKMLLS